MSPWEVRERFCRRAIVVCNDELSYNGKPHKPSAYRQYLAKDLMYLRSAVYGRSGRTTDPPQRWVTLAPEGIDVLKREIYNNRWRSGGESGDWDRATHEQSIAQRREQLSEQHLYTHSIAAFAGLTILSAADRGDREGAAADQLAQSDIGP